MTRRNCLLLAGGGRKLAPDLVGKPSRFTVLFLMLFALFGWQSASAADDNSITPVDEGRIVSITSEVTITFDKGAVVDNTGPYFAFSGASTGGCSPNYYLKLESSTVVKFKTNAASTLTVVFDDNTKNTDFLLDGQAKTAVSGSKTIEVDLDGDRTFTLTKKSTNTYIKSIKVKPTGAGASKVPLTAEWKDYLTEFVSVSGNKFNLNSIIKVKAGSSTLSSGNYSLSVSGLNANSSGIVTETNAGNYTPSLTIAPGSSYSDDYREATLSGKTVTVQPNVYSLTEITGAKKWTPSGIAAGKYYDKTTAADNTLRFYNQEDKYIEVDATQIKTGGVGLFSGDTPYSRIIEFKIAGSAAGGKVVVKFKGSNGRSVTIKNGSNTVTSEDISSSSIHTVELTNATAGSVYIYSSNGVNITEISYEPVAYTVEWNTSLLTLKRWHEKTTPSLKGLLTVKDASGNIVTNYTFKNPVVQSLSGGATLSFWDQSGSNSSTDAQNYSIQGAGDAGRCKFHVTIVPASGSGYLEATTEDLYVNVVTYADNALPALTSVNDATTLFPSASIPDGYYYNIVNVTDYLRYYLIGTVDNNNSNPNYLKVVDGELNLGGGKTLSWNDSECNRLLKFLVTRDGKVTIKGKNLGTQERKLGIGNDLGGGNVTTETVTSYGGEFTKEVNVKAGGILVYYDTNGTYDDFVITEITYEPTILPLTARWKLEKVFVSRYRNTVDINDLVEVKAGDVVLTSNDFAFASLDDNTKYMFFANGMQGRSVGEHEIKLRITGKGEYADWEAVEIEGLPLVVKEDKGTVEDGLYNGLTELPTLYKARTWSPSNLEHGAYYDVMNVGPDNAMRFYLKQGSRFLIDGNDLKLGGVGSSSANEGDCDRVIKFQLGLPGTLKVKVSHGSTTSNDERKLHVVSYENGAWKQDYVITISTANTNNGADGETFDVPRGDVIIYAEGGGMNIAEITYSPTTPFPDELNLCSGTSNTQWNGGAALTAEGENGVYRWTNVIVPSDNFEFKAYNETTFYRGAPDTNCNLGNNPVTSYGSSTNENSWKIAAGTYNIILDLNKNTITAVRGITWDFTDSDCYQNEVDGTSLYKSVDGTNTELYFNHGNNDRYGSSYEYIYANGTRTIRIPVTGAGTLYIKYGSTAYGNDCVLYDDPGQKDANKLATITGNKNKEWGYSSEVTIAEGKQLYVKTGQNWFTHITWIPAETQPLMLSWRYPRVVVARGKTRIKLNRLLKIRCEGMTEEIEQNWSNGNYFLSYKSTNDFFSSTTYPSENPGHVSITGKSNVIGLTELSATVTPQGEYSKYREATIGELPVDVIPGWDEANGLYGLKAVATNRPTIWRYSQFDKALYLDVVNLATTLRLHVSKGETEWYGKIGSYDSNGNGGEYSEKYCDNGVVIDEEAIRLSEGNVDNKYKVLEFKTSVSGTVKITSLAAAKFEVNGTEVTTSENEGKYEATAHVNASGETSVFIRAKQDADLTELMFTPDDADPELSADELVTTLKRMKWSDRDAFGFTMTATEKESGKKILGEALNDGTSTTPANTIRVYGSQTETVDSKKSGLSYTQSLDLVNNRSYAEIRVLGPGVLIINASSNGPSRKELFVTTKKPNTAAHLDTEETADVNNLKWFGEEGGCLVDSISYKYQYTRSHYFHAEADFNDQQEETLYIWSSGGVHIFSMEWVPAKYIDWTRDANGNIVRDKDGKPVEKDSKPLREKTMLPDVCEWTYKTETGVNYRNSELWLDKRGTEVIYKRNDYDGKANETKYPTNLLLTAYVGSKATETDGMVGESKYARTPMWWSSAKTNVSNSNNTNNQLASYFYNNGDKDADNYVEAEGTNNDTAYEGYSRVNVTAAGNIGSNLSQYWGIMYMVAGTQEGNIRDYCRVEVAGPAMGLTWDLSLEDRADVIRDAGKIEKVPFTLQAKPWCEAKDDELGKNVYITLEDPRLVWSVSGTGVRLTPTGDNDNACVIDPSNAPNGVYVVTATTKKTADNLGTYSVNYIFKIGDEDYSHDPASVETFIYNVLQRTKSDLDNDISAGKLLSEQYTGSYTADKKGNDRSDIFLVDMATNDAGEYIKTNSTNSKIIIKPLVDLQNPPAIESVEINCLRKYKDGTKDYNVPANATINIKYGHVDQVQTVNGEITEYGAQDNLLSNNFVLNYDNNYTARLEAPDGININKAEISFNAADIRINQIKVNYYSRIPDDIKLAPWTFETYGSGSDSHGVKEHSLVAFADGVESPITKGHRFTYQSGAASPIHMQFKKSQQYSRYFNVKEAYIRNDGSSDEDKRGEKQTPNFRNNVLVIADDENAPCTMLFHNIDNKAEITSIEFYYETDHYMRNGFDTGRRLFCSSDPRYNPVPGRDQYVGYPLEDLALEPGDTYPSGANDVYPIRKMVYRPESPVSFATISTDRHEEGFLFIRQIVVKYSEGASLNTYKLDIPYDYVYNYDLDAHVEAVANIKCDATNAKVIQPNITDATDVNDPVLDDIDDVTAKKYQYAERNKAHKYLLKRTSLENNTSYDVALERTDDSDATNIELVERGGTGNSYMNNKFYTLRVLNENRMVIRQMTFQVEPLEMPKISYDGIYNRETVANEPIKLSDGKPVKIEALGSSREGVKCHDYHILIWTDDNSEPTVTFDEDGRNIIDIHGNVGTDRGWDKAELYSLKGRFDNNNNTIVFKALCLPMKSLPENSDDLLKSTHEARIEALKDMAPDQSYGENSLTSRAYYTCIDDNTDYIEFAKNDDDEYIINRSDIGEYAFTNEDEGKKFKGGFTKYVKNYSLNLTNAEAPKSKLALTYGGYERFIMPTSSSEARAKAPGEGESQVFNHDIISNDYWKVVPTPLSGKLGIHTALVNNAYIEANIEPLNEKANNGGYNAETRELSAGKPIKDGVRIWSGEFDHNAHSKLIESNGEDNQRHLKTWNMPCYGGYLMFEPEADGDLTVYVKQPGAMEIEDDVLDDVMVKMRPVYIYDEAGNTPEGIRAYTTSKVSGNWNTTLHTEIVGDKYMTAEQSETFIQMCKEWIQNNTANENGDVEYGDRAYKSQGIILAHKPNDAADCNIYDQDGNKFVYGDYYNEYMSSINSFAYGKDADAEDNKLENNGFMLVSEGYVRYEIPVRAGKTYFMFCNRGKLGLAAHSFEPKAVTNGTVYTIGGNSDNWKNAPTNAPVTIKLDRTFKNDTWAALVLPFSIGKTELRRAFGDGVYAIHFNEITTKLLRFTHHVHQMVVAGTPIFIKPHFNDLAEGATIDPNKFVFKNVTIEEPKNGEYQIYPITSGTGELRYMCTGSYEPRTEVPVNSWFISGGKFSFRSENKKSISPATRAWIVPVTQEAQNAAPRLAAALASGVDNYDDLDQEDNNTTGFIQLVTDPKEIEDEFVDNNNVYNLKGQLVRKGTTDVTGLPKGVYIVNGVKRVVK